MDKQQVMIVDTNVLLEKPDAFLGFPSPTGRLNRIMIPMGVLKEIDVAKNEKEYGNFTDKAILARETGKRLKELSSNGYRLSDGIKVKENYIVESNFVIEKDKFKMSLDDILSTKHADERTLKTAYSLKEQGIPVEIITFDTTLSDIASAMGLTANPWMDFVREREIKEVYKGWREITRLSGGKIERFEKEGFISPSEIDDLKEVQLHPNEYVYNVLRNGEIGSFVARYDAKLELLVPLINYANRKCQDVLARNVWQKCLMDATFNDEIDTVFAIGIAGTGKTFVALNGGLDQTNMSNYHRKNEKKAEFKKEQEDYNRNKGARFNKLLLTRPIVGDDDEEEVGFVPGEMGDKLVEWLGPFYDQFDHLFSLHQIPQMDREDYFEHRNIEVQRLRTMQGRTFPKLYWVVDEAENIRDKGFRRIFTRAASESKIIVCGDPQQTLLKNEGIFENSLLYHANTLKDDPRTATMVMDEIRMIERGPITQKYYQYFGQQLRSELGNYGKRT